MIRRLIILLLIVGCGTEPEDVTGCCHHRNCFSIGNSNYQCNNICHEDKSEDYCESQYADDLNTLTFYEGDINCQEPSCD